MNESVGLAKPECFFFWKGVADPRSLKSGTGMAVADGVGEGAGSVEFSSVELRGAPAPLGSAGAESAGATLAGILGVVDGAADDGVLGGVVSMNAGAAGDPVTGAVAPIPAGVEAADSVVGLGRASSAIGDRRGWLKLLERSAI